MRLAADAVRAGARLVVAVGGDGTLSEVANGVTTPEAAEPRTPVAAILTGRGRDACRNLGIRRDSLEAARRVVEGTAVAVDLGLAEWAGGHRFFVNAFGAGFDAEVAARAAAGRGGGMLPYLRAVAMSVRGYRPVEMTLEIDGTRRASAPAAAVIVSNGPCFGGGMRIAPPAEPVDGVLDLVELGPFQRWELVCWLPTIYWGGHLRSRHVRVSRVRHVRLETRAPITLQMDGELCGTTPVSIRVCPGRLLLRR